MTATALIVIDMLNHYGHDDADLLMDDVKRILPSLQRLIHEARSREIVPFVVKRRHSIFYETLLEYLLHEREVTQIILAGQVTEQCILYSALDAYLRHFKVIVTRDCVAHIHEDLAEASLKMMERNMRAEVVVTVDEALGLS